MAMDIFGLNFSKLNLKNFATFDDQEIHFDSNFNAIVGETGSGKSLILDALQLILGHRADKKLIRKDCDFAIVEAILKCNDPNISKYFIDSGYPFDDSEIVIKRILYKTGKTKSYLNHQSCSLSTLTDFSKNFIDLVGQFENQKLLSDDYQLKLLDNYSTNNTLTGEYKKTYDSYLQAKRELEEAERKNSEYSQKMDYLNFQIKELEQLSPKTEREFELLEKKRLLQNLEENRDSVAHLNQLFDGTHSSVGVLDLLNKIDHLINDKLLDEESLNSFQVAKENIADLNYKINSSLDIDFNEGEFEEVLSELDRYQKLKRKFNVDTEGLITIYKNFLQEKDEIQNTSDTVQVYKGRINNLFDSCKDIAKKIHDRRVINSKTLAKKLSLEIQNLRMLGATIKIQLTENETLTKSGISNIEFLAETNPGEGFYKIKDIASGGELSRILLALRTVLSTRDSISIFLFDEIDSGIGGETALTVGKALSQVANSSQVIAITHLPQIANFSQKLIMVSKDVINKNSEERTISVIKEISGKQLKEQVQHMGALN